MELKPGTFCPLIKKDCIQMRCAFFTHLRGTNPNTGKEVDEWGCAVTWLPILLVETAKEVRQGAAATESFRNEVVRAREAPPRVVAQQQITETRDAPHDHSI
jgi:hypothetical protein